MASLQTMYFQLLSALAFLALTLSNCETLDASDAEGIDFFEQKVRPLLIEHCYECHSAEANEGNSLEANLYLDSRDGWQSGGDSGPAIIPGDAKGSLLMQSVSYANKDLQMPPDGRLEDSEIEVLRKWVSLGAPDPREGEVIREDKMIDMERGRQFWAFVPPANHPVPEVEDRSWSRNTIDPFILSRLEHEGIVPSVDASPRALIRRVYYDLIGQPPSRDQVNAFVADSSASSFELIVDELLKRPEFGERWGRHWLDVARFAESSGGGRSLVFPEAWRYRDYVIEAFNEDKPYDDFIREQIAGDILSFDTIKQRNAQITGSGYLVLGAINYELQDKELLRMEIVDEQIDTMGRTFLGMTLGCARCHDHKFDPIPTTDYYALAGIFQSTQSLGEGSAAAGVASFSIAKLSNPPTEESKGLHERRENIALRVAQLKEQLGKSRVRGMVNPSDLPGVVVDSSDAAISGQWMHSTSNGAWIGDGYLHDQALGDGKANIDFAAVLPADGKYEVLVAYPPHANRCREAPFTVTHAGGETTVVVDQSKSSERFGCFESLGEFDFSKDLPAHVSLSNSGTRGYLIADAVCFLAVGQHQPSSQSMDRETLKYLESELESINQQIGEFEFTVMAPKESESPSDGFVHIRGQVRNKGQRVPRGFLTVASKRGEAPAIKEHSSGRRELADWIASPENPLTARVMVNRIWKHLLGEGIVRTPDNFGTTGELPSHVELLDHLALEFVSKDWSIKSLIRKIVLSRTYQLSSSEISSGDPENRLFGRANRKRLDAESIRDSMLVVSGQLDPTRGGLTIRKLGQYDSNYSFDTNRRSVYVPWFRNSVLGLFEVFDGANPNLVTGKRSVTNLPTQSLFLMNSPFVREQSEQTARRLIETSSSIDDAYELILGRPASMLEKQTTTAFLAEFPVTDQDEAWTQLCHTLFACLDFRFLD